MQDHCITVELGLPALRVVACERIDGAYVVTVRYRERRRSCPRCGCETDRVHQYHRQLKAHTPLWGQTVVLVLEKRRFRCPGCGRAFMEPDEVCGSRRRSTRAFRGWLAGECLGGTVKGVARKAGVSEALVRRALGEATCGVWGGASGEAAVLALDELCVGTRAGVLTLVYAPEERRVVAIGRGRTQATAERLLLGLGDGSQVRAVVIDMSETYRQAVRYACPGAVIVADKFHVLARVLRALGRVLTRVQSGAPAEDLRGLRTRRLFSAPSGRLNAAQVRERDRLLARYTALGEAWQMTQAFRAIYHCRSRAEAAVRLDGWWAAAQHSGPREFRGLRHMLTCWREEILNYFEHRVTNGFAEGKNNRIKAIVRRGYGYRNLENLTRRILLTNPPLPAATEAFSPHLLT